MTQLPPVFRVPETQTFSPSPSISESQRSLQHLWALDQVFAQRLLQLFQDNLCQRKRCGGTNTALQPESALEGTRTIIIILGFLCHQRRQESVMGRQFWVFSSPLSAEGVFSLHEMGWIQILLLLWVKELLLCPSASWGAHRVVGRLFISQALKTKITTLVCLTLFS